MLGDGERETAQTEEKESDEKKRRAAIVVTIECVCEGG